MDKLKPCPFCGGEARVREFRTYKEECHGIMPKYYIQCNLCTVDRPQTHWDKRDAIAEWNRRPSHE